jgi:hypothetical protein
MTPLEELQAAHERLTELRGDPWALGGNAEPSELTWVLHRTIDAQLRLLSSHIYTLRTKGGGPDAVHMALARSINATS